MRDEMAMKILVDDAVQGDESAWNTIVRSYTPLIRSICRRYCLSPEDRDDVASRVWMHLLADIRRIREPAALPGWLRTTARRECLAVVWRTTRDMPFGEDEFVHLALLPADAGLLAEEQRIVLREAISSLTEQDRRLLSMLFCDPPMSYEEISVVLGIKRGSIGPTRQRILLRLRKAEVWRAYEPTF
ncbi:sigma-70 family RNA polymerase sigma factor [Lentzea sp. NPDC005914]|uniref:RNA polymerase sigma factor n=1 Tax=Lentzea sp. NPDC005914 TaxID=3154572 RepID=UPI0033F745EA